MQTRKGIARIGTSTNDSAAAGEIGELITATVASGAAVALTSPTAKNVTSVSLTAGDWDVSGAVSFTLAGATCTLAQAGISAATNALPTQAGGSGIGTDPLVGGSFLSTALTGVQNLAIPPVRVTLAATTTIYLVAQTTFSLGTSAAYGTIRARRIR